MLDTEPLKIAEASHSPEYGSVLLNEVCGVELELHNHSEY
jgi:hypothetical protein